MQGIRRSRLVVALLVTSIAGCGGGDATPPSEPDPTVDASVPTTLGVPEESIADEPAPDATAPDGSTTDGEPAPLDPSTFPDAPAPGALAEAVLPADEDGVVALFQALPVDVLGAAIELSAPSPGQLDAQYRLADRTIPIGFQALDLRSSGFGEYLPEATAEQLVTLFAQGADWDVEAFGRDGERFWVLWSTTGSGEGIDGVELISILSFGDAGSPWAFILTAADPGGRDDLLAAFVAAAAAVPEPEVPGPDEEAADAALLTASDLGPEWRHRIDLPQDGQFHALATGVMTDEPACVAALDWIEREDVTLTGWLDILLVGSVAGAESPRLVTAGDRLSVEHTVVVFETAEGAARALATLRELGWDDCVIAVSPALMQSMFGAAFPGARVVVDAAGPRPIALGDDAAATRFELTLEAPGSGGTVESAQDVSIVAVGRAISAVVQQSFGVPLDDARVDEIVQLAVDRVSDGFG